MALAAPIAQYESVSKGYGQIPDFHVASGVSHHHLFMLTPHYRVRAKKVFHKQVPIGYLGCLMLPPRFGIFG